MNVYDYDDVWKFSLSVFTYNFYLYFLLVLNYFWVRFILLKKMNKLQFSRVEAPTVDPLLFYTKVIILYLGIVTLFFSTFRKIVCFNFSDEEKKNYVRYFITITYEKNRLIKTAYNNYLSVFVRFGKLCFRKI